MIAKYRKSRQPTARLYNAGDTITIGRYDYVIRGYYNDYYVLHCEDTKVNHLLCDNLIQGLRES